MKARQLITGVIVGMSGAILMVAGVGTVMYLVAMMVEFVCALGSK
jgi:hypothetical protein